jgi:hypothetical protein
MGTSPSYDRPMIVLGLMLVGVGVIMGLAASGGLSKRMPTQVPPRAMAAVPILIGAVLVVADLMS